MKVTFDSLLASRCDVQGKPLYWKPPKLKYTPLQHCIYGIPKACERVLALQLALELTVKDFVLEASKTELPISKSVKKLLLTNIADENVHHQAFTYASDVYRIQDAVQAEADVLAQFWIEMPGHPLEKSALLECGVFTPALAFLQVCGGQSLMSVAALVAKDEQRHVATNRGICRKLGINPSEPSNQFRSVWYASLDWLFDGLSVPADVLPDRCVSGIFDKDFLVSESANLVTYSYSKRLDDLLSQSSIYVPPFEKENNDQSY